MILLFVLFGFVMCCIYIYFTETNHSKVKGTLSPTTDDKLESAISSHELQTFTEADSARNPVTEHEASKIDDAELLEKEDSSVPFSEDVDANTIFDATTQELRTKIASLKLQIEELSNQIKTYTATGVAAVTAGICSSPKFFSLRGFFFTVIICCISVVSSTSIFPQFNNLPTTTTSITSFRLPHLTQSNNVMTEYQKENLDASTFSDNITYDDIINDPRIKETVNSIDRNEMIKFVSDGLKSINHLVELK